MDKPQDLMSWFKRMGYDGKMPESFDNEPNGGNEKRANVPSINITTQHLELTTQHLELTTQHLDANGQNLNQRRLNFEVMYNNEFVINQLKTLLYNHNRQIIWNTMQILNDNLNSEITKNVTFKCEQNVRNKNINQDDVARLQFLHIQTELQILKLKAVSKDLSNKINKRKKQICEAINKRVVSLDRANCIERSFVEQLEDVGLDAVLIQMKKEINSAKKIEDSTELQITLGKTAQVKSDITQKVATIKHYVNNIYETLQSTMSTREQTVACVRKLGPFVEDLTWSLPLTKDLCSSEAKTFEKFPLEYNRRCVYTDPRIYYRDIITDNIPTDVELDSDSTFMLTTILESPYSPPETVLLNILKSKMKLDALKSIGNCTANIIHNSLKELQAQESYVQYALDRLNSILYSTSSNKTLATADLMKRVIQIWMEMPLKGLISSKRKVEGKDYNYYEKQYDSFYNNI
ncbi:hypothetical protein NQ318_000988 [Aromia moschata]|uniref:Uncharacterized protein n=1 Tax=Aromia moschata TaxID=1265417 RepID=A0AAV8ZE62_9CUCU|nr:hypothetical protein NQ318_000988 [Aromia moschata]